MAPPAHSSPPPVPSPLLPSSGCPTQIQTLRITSTQALIDAFTAVLPSPPLPPLPPLPLSLYIPPPVDRRDDIPESEQPPRKRLYLSTLGSRYEVEESSTARPTRGRGIYYGFVSTVDAEERRQGTRDVGYVLILLSTVSLLVKTVSYKLILLVDFLSSINLKATSTNSKLVLLVHFPGFQRSIRHEDTRTPLHPVGLHHHRFTYLGQRTHRHRQFPQDEDEHEFLAEEQPLPGHITESDPEEDPEEYEDDEIEDGPVDYPMDDGDDKDDDDGNSSWDDADDEDEDDEDEEEEEHLAPVDSTIVVP
ncbi:hypothetical protein Tco_0151938 [Tanacetum coccineum]